MENNCRIGTKADQWQAFKDYHENPPRGYVLVTTCGTRLCIEPTHLDMAKASPRPKYAIPPKGGHTKHSRPGLSTHRLIEIYKASKRPGFDVEDVAFENHVTTRTLEAILRVMKEEEDNGTPRTP
jgi:hypothetical protein